MPAMVDLAIEQFMTPVNTVLRSNFITARAVASQMLKQGSGVIIFLTGSPARPHGPGTSGIGAANGAIENLTRSLAIELGPAGVQSRLPTHRCKSRYPHDSGDLRDGRQADELHVRPSRRRACRKHDAEGVSPHLRHRESGRSPSVGSGADDDGLRAQYIGRSGPRLGTARPGQPGPVMLFLSRAAK